MRYIITSQQISYFRKESEITFEELFSKEEARDLKTLLDTSLLQHTNASQNKLLAGRDSHRENPAIEKALHFTKIAQAASALFGKKTLRIAFSQYEPSYPSIASIEELTSMTGTCGGALIHLNPESSTFGSITFYLLTAPIDFTSIDMPALLLSFATDKARYQIREKDPLTHHLKKLGYGFGDRITPETHPFIIK